MLVAGEVEAGERKGWDGEKAERDGVGMHALEISEYG